MRISPSCWGTNAEPSFFHQNIRVRLASFLYAKQRPEPSPCISAQDKRPERLATSPPSSRGAGTEAPSGGWGPGAERGPHSCTRLLQSYPPPEPQPREQPETGNACYQGLIRETKSREGPLRSALKPPNHGAARSHLAGQRGWACCAPFLKPGSRGAEHKLPTLACRPSPCQPVSPLSSGLLSQHALNSSEPGQGGQTNTVRLPAHALKAEGPWVAHSIFCYLGFLIFTLGLKTLTGSALWHLARQAGSSIHSGSIY